MKRTKKILAMLLCAVLLVTGTVAVTVAYLTSTTEAATNTFTVGDVKIILNEKDEDSDNNTDVNYVYISQSGEVNRDTTNAYHVFPNGTYGKDPMVSVRADSEDCYIRMIVTVSDIEALEDAMPNYRANDENKTFLLQNLVDWKSESWPFYKYHENVVGEGENAITEGIYEFRYEGKYSVPDEADTVKVINRGNSEENGEYVELEPLFTEITLPEWIKNDQLAMLDGVSIKVVAHAMQADGFEDTVDDEGNITKSAEEKAWTAFDKEKNGN